MTKYQVVTPNKMIGFDTHKEAFAHYETQSKPCGVYEVSSQGDKVYAVNVKADIHGDFNEPECFIHLHNKLNKHNYKVGTRCKN